MTRKLTIAIVGFALVLCSFGSSSGQPLNAQGDAGEKSFPFLARNLAVNLTVEPQEVEEGFTLLTATGQFMIKADLKGSERPMRLEFKGRIYLHETMLRIGERDLSVDTPIRATYTVTIRETSASENADPSFLLEGSAVMKENAQIVIARSRDVILKLTIHTAD